MRRLLFTILSALSLLLCVAVCVLWVRSYWRFVDFGVQWSQRDEAAYTSWLARLGSSKGRMIFTYRGIIWPWTNPSAAEVSVGWERNNGRFWRSDEKLPDFEGRKDPRKGEWGFDRFGFTVWHLDRPPGPMVVPANWPAGMPVPLEPGMTGIVLIAPHPFIAAVLAVPPGRWLMSYWRRRRNGLCPACGYDLRATPRRCPECGHEPSPPAAEAQA